MIEELKERHERLTSEKAIVERKIVAHRQAVVDEMANLHRYEGALKECELYIGIAMSKQADANAA